MPRRNFVVGLVSLVAGGWLWSYFRPTGIVRAAAQLHAPRVLSHAAFAACRGEPFSITPMKVDGTRRALEAHLAEVTDLRPHAAPARAARGQGGECFALRFHGPAGQALTQDTYQFAHRRLGTFLLFIVPGLSAADGIHYEAVINRLPAGVR